MFFDTHCHLNFKVFEEKVGKVIGAARRVGVDYFVVPGTDVESSKKGVKIAEKFKGVYAAVGIHPHHLFEIYQKVYHPLGQDGSPKILSQLNSPPHQILVRGLKHPVSENFGSPSSLSSIEKLLTHPKVVAVGEVGLDRYYYQKTKYKNYQIDEEFINLQKIFFLEQIKLARKFKKTLIIHNRQAKTDLIAILTNIKYLISNIKVVFHCCEPDDDLLEFAKEHQIFIGVDGDVTYDKRKQEFVKKIPLDLLVLETDSPFLMPKFVVRRSSTSYNQPKNLPLIAEFIAKLKNLPLNQLIEATTVNAKKLFGLY